MSRYVFGTGLVCMLLVTITGCVKRVDSEKKRSSTESSATGNATSGKDSLSGKISILGSSTVYPISQAVVEQFEKDHKGVKVDLSSSGTTSGFTNLISGNSDIANASRPVTESELEKCKAAGIELVEIQIAIDGLTVVINPENDWVDCLSIEELKAMWEPNSKVKTWKDVRDGWPNEPIELFGADTASGTFDYFTEAVVGKAKASRSDYSANSNDNILVQGVGNSKYGLGYFGYAYYAENTKRVNAASIKDPKTGNCVAPTPETIENGTYRPLSRPLFIYTTKKALQRPVVAEFCKYFLTDAGQEMVTAVKYVRPSADALAKSKKTLDDAISAAPAKTE